MLAWISPAPGHMVVSGAAGAGTAAFANATALQYHDISIGQVKEYEESSGHVKKK